MQLGMIGLGRMGANLVRRLVRQGHDCVVFDQSPETVAGLVGQSITGAADLADLVAGLARPRNVWVMLPAGEITEQTVAELGRLQGWSPQETLARTVEQLSPAHQAVMASAIQAGRIDYAQAYMERVQAELTPQARLDLRKHLEAGATALQASQTADRIWQTAGLGRDLNAPVDQYGMEQAARAAKANQDLTASVDALADMDDAMKRLPKWAIRGAMMDRLQSDGRFLQLWLNRHADPQTWDKAREALGKELLKDLPADDNVTGSRMAARAAVRGNPGKNTPDAPPDFSKMTPAEIMRYSQEHGEKNARRRG